MASVTLTDEQRQAIVDAAIQSIREKAIREATDSLAGWTRSAIAETLDAEVRELIKAEIVPAVKEQILINKAVLVEAAVAAAGDIAEAIRAMLVKRLTEQLSSGYKQAEVVTALFGKY